LVSKYENYKIVISNGKITRNPKIPKEIGKAAELQSDLTNKIQSTSEIFMVKSGKGVHAAATNKKTNIMALFTTKEQEDQSALLIHKVEESRAYAQILGEKNRVITFEKIIKPEIRKLLVNQGLNTMVMANRIISKTDGKIIVVNRHNKQHFID
jgi:hypothetical protein